ncbi:lipopolysaccharide biosynthesis protein [Bacteroides pyogenes]|uniref:lipopolysaccharide biosynthesis protein n=1 Tax=Bacteroides pyogenes TaxID=310300 RepID=UPI002FD977E2
MILIDKLNKSSFLKNILILATGSFVAQIIAIACSPILTRIYSAEEMGVFTYIISLTAIFMGVINARYDMSIVTEKDDSNIIPLLQLSFIIGLIATVLSTIALGIAIEKQGLSAIWTLYTFFILLSYSIINPLTAYNNRYKEYTVISKTYTLRKTIQNIGAMLAGIITKTGHGLILPYVIGQYLGIDSQSKTLRTRVKELMSLKKKKIIDVAKKHKNQPLYSLPAQLANSLSYSLITVFVTNLFGLATVGYYAISVKLLGLPLALIGSNISKVFVERAAVEYKQFGGYKNSFNKTFLILLVITIPMVIILYIVSPWVCEWFLGKGWGVSGEYIRILAPMFGVRFITSALSPALIIVSKQKFEFLLQLLFLIFNLTSFIIAKVYVLDIEGFLNIVNVLFSLAYALYLHMVYRYSKPRNNA